MSAIPAEPPVTMADLGAWFEMKKQLQALQASEMLLRKRIAKHYFPAPKEGTNTFVLPDGYRLQLVHGIDRKLDMPAFETLKDDFIKRGIPADHLIRYKVELALPAYRELTAEEQMVFDQCLTIKDSSPSMKVEKPSTKGK